MKRAREDPMVTETVKRTTYRQIPVDQQNHRPLKVEDALAYLDKVKTQFGNQPQIYNRFLEIMKNFKAQTIDTPGVIHEVSELFKGHDNLILGFNTFLPPGYKIEITTEQVRRPAPRDTDASPAALSAAVSGAMPVSPTPAMSGQAQGISQAAAAAAAQAVREHGHPQEFNHAINYVTKIKRRFVDDPNTYKSFLDILHAYQKQQRSIKDVLEKVSHLFRDHTDLLRDFKYFLPHAVQPQADEILKTKVSQLQRAAAGAQARKAGRGMPRRDRDRPDVGDRAPEPEEPVEAERMVKRPRRRERQIVTGVEESLQVSLPPSERAFFERLKVSIGSNERWNELLKCLDLAAREIVSQSELLALLTDVFGDNQLLMEDFKSLIHNRGTADAEPGDVWFIMPMSEIDFSKSRVIGTSYRALPEKYPRFSCSERSALDQEVLNDTWVSVPTGSEDYSFKSMRKNQYEEALFLCEDERYEVDMVIDNNASAIRVLEPIAEEIATIQAAEPSDWQFRLDSRSLGVIHLKAIVRVYGDNGADMLEWLRKKPADAIPVILRRLKQKDAEWRQARQELNARWKDVLEKNYDKSLDHRSFYFKQADKKALGFKNLLTDIKSIVEARMAGSNSAPGSSTSTTTGSSAAAAAISAATAGLKPEGTTEPHMKFQFSDASVQHDAEDVIAYAVEKLAGDVDKERIAGLWGCFLERFYRFPEEWTNARRAGAVEDLSPIRVGATVQTPYGVGVVEQIHIENGVRVHVVILPWGTAHLQANAVSVDRRTGVQHFSAPFSSSAVGKVRPLVTVPTAAGAGAAAAAAPNGAAAGAASGTSTVSTPTSVELQNASCSVGTNVFLGTSNAYLFFVLHAKLLERLSRAKELCAAQSSAAVQHPLDASGKEEEDIDMVEAAPAAGSSAAAAKASQNYKYYLTALYSLIEGQLDNSKYEDECRKLMGTGSYLLFTMDKLLQNLVKQLSPFVNDRMCTQARALFAYQQQKSAVTEDPAVHRALEQSYRSNCAVVMESRNEDCYAIEYQTFPAVGGAPQPAEIRVSFVGKPAFVGSAATLKAPVPAAASNAVQHMTSVPAGESATQQLLAGFPRASGSGAMQVNGVSAQVTTSGKLVYQPGSTDITLRRPTGPNPAEVRSPTHMQAYGQMPWAATKLASFGEQPADSVFLPSGARVPAVVSAPLSAMPAITHFAPSPAMPIMLGAGPFDALRGDAGASMMRMRLDFPFQGAADVKPEAAGGEEPADAATAGVTKLLPVPLPTFHAGGFPTQFPLAPPAAPMLGMHASPVGSPTSSGHGTGLPLPKPDM